VVYLTNSHLLFACFFSQIFAENSFVVNIYLRKFVNHLRKSARNLYILIFYQASAISIRLFQFVELLIIPTN